MQTLSGQKTRNGSAAAFQSSTPPDLVSINKHAKQLKIREFISWSVCVGVIGLLTGLLKFLKIGVTMDSVTSGLFYISIAGFTWLIYKIYKVSKGPSRSNNMSKHELN